MSVWAFEEIFAASHTLPRAPGITIRLPSVAGDAAATITPIRQDELLSRWPGDVDLLIRELTVRGGPPWPREPQRRRAILNALTRGLKERP